MATATTMVPPKTLNKRSSAWLHYTASHGFQAVLLFVAVVVLTVILSTTTGTTTNNGSTRTSTGPSASDFEMTPMCNAQGVCGEEATVPSPRTVYSAKSLEQYDKWWRAHKKLKESAEEFAASTTDKRRLIFLGDSITESWLGTNMGDPTARAEGVPQVFQTEFSDFETLVLAIGGDQVQHLEWRLFEDGELPEAILGSKNESSSTTFVLLIGTNNLGSGMLPGPTTDGVLHFLQTLQSKTEAEIKVLQILPRGDAFRLPNICPPRCKKDGSPFTSFMPAVQMVNEGLAKHLSASPMKGVSLVDCNADFVGREGEEVDDNLMSDKLHPNVAGHVKLAQCIKKHLT